MASFLGDYRSHIWKFINFLVYYISYNLFFVSFRDKIIYSKLIKTIKIFVKIVRFGWMGEIFVSGIKELAATLWQHTTR